MTATTAGETFTLVDESSATPTRERPHATRRATVRVSVPETPAGAARVGVILEVAATVEQPNARMKLELTQPDGQRKSSPKSVTSGLVFCPTLRSPCELTFGLLMTYDGMPGSDRVSWKANATARAYAAEGAAAAPPAPRAPVVTPALLPP